MGSTPAALRRVVWPLSAEQRAIPSWGRAIIDRMWKEGLSDLPFDQMLVNEYLPGQGIAMHVDYEPFGRTVASVSLLSRCVMDFRHVETDQRESMWLAPRSLLILSDEARYQWRHGISRRKTDLCNGVRIPRERRLSITFRRLVRRGSGSTKTVS